MALRSPVWSTGLFFGNDPLRGPEWRAPSSSADILLNAHGLKLQSDAVHTHADPFLFVEEGSDRCFLFVEEQRRRQPGRIMVYDVGAERKLTLLGPVTGLPAGHLSYPFVFAAEGEIYMLPETGSSGHGSGDGEIALYRFTDFPRRLEKAATLLEGAYADSSILELAGTYFLFTFRDDEGLLFTAPELTGPYRPHPASPFSRDAGSARCGGALIAPTTARPFFVRPAQDCRASYGGDLRLMKVMSITADDYVESVWADKCMTGSQPWAATGSHHLSQCCWRGEVITAVDGRRDDHLLNRAISMVLPS